MIPADDKLKARLIVSEVILETLKDFKMKYPMTDATRRNELVEIREKLLKSK